ncbi:hypothetical protein N9B31_00760 [Mariniblastus sp.]|nr:hypothetical protein [bacterium]MDA7902165.1 hypothetical protein [Mariniblastus sp.]MDA7923938.1 hypothetical protein [Mariniblastus sp.]MDB4460349.1 hypothetical protein [bacterium]MDB4483906.1 hypothetical protein [bacterium]
MIRKKYYESGDLLNEIQQLVRFSFIVKDQADGMLKSNRANFQKKKTNAEHRAVAYFLLSQRLM